MKQCILNRKRGPDVKVREKLQQQSIIINRVVPHTGEKLRENCPSLCKKKKKLKTK